MASGVSFTEFPMDRMTPRGVEIPTYQIETEVQPQFFHQAPNGDLIVAIGCPDVIRDLPEKTDELVRMPTTMGLTFSQTKFSLGSMLLVLTKYKATNTYALYHMGLRDFEERGDYIECKIGPASVGTDVFHIRDFTRITLKDSSGQNVLVITKTGSQILMSPSR